MPSSQTGLICVLGDAHLDVVVQLRGPVQPDTDTSARTALSVGGQAANVAAWVSALGGRSRLITALSSDLASGLVRAQLTRRGVEVVGPVIAGSTGTVVSLSDDGAKRSMLTDRGVGPMLAAEAIDPAWLTGCQWLHLPGYSLLAEPVRSASMAAAAAAREAGARISVDLSSTASITESGLTAFHQAIADISPDLVFGTDAELHLVGLIPGVLVVEKLGSAGVRVAGKHYPAIPAQAVDATGAGDAFAAGYLIGGVDIGLAAAARAVAKMGAMP